MGLLDFNFKLCEMTVVYRYAKMAVELLGSTDCARNQLKGKIQDDNNIVPLEDVFIQPSWPGLRSKLFHVGVNW